MEERQSEGLAFSVFVSGCTVVIYNVEAGLNIENDLLVKIVCVAEVNIH